MTEGRSETYAYSKTYWETRADPGFASVQFPQLWWCLFTAVAANDAADDDDVDDDDDFTDDRLCSTDCRSKWMCHFQKNYAFKSTSAKKKKKTY